jgi:hypothetical protein
MGADIAHVSYDETRDYRAVVAQQGRVTVEADDNEAWTIAREETRRELLATIGPAGTPDDGYKVLEPGAATTPAFDFQVGLGTMYVGGVRSFRPASGKYSEQAEWLDRVGDPDWVAPNVPADSQLEQELVYLSLVEREVSAVEDRALLEVALGGPDTSQRVRLVQRVKRLGTGAETCEAAMADAEAAWAGQGLALDRQSMRLDSTARLQVSFASAGSAPQPCEPEAQGGYLGADNQLIRVQVVAWDEQTGTGRLVWGFDNASFLYRVNLVSRRQLELQSRPPDDLHQPRAGQAVEVLRSAVRLGPNGEHMASAAGQVVTLANAYVPETRQITLPSDLPQVYADPARTPVVFLRVWEEEQPFTPGTPLALDPPGRPTGLRVTLTTDGGGPFHPGDFWLLAVRPTTPDQVYPRRYLRAPQPADGPRQWACPLAVVRWSDGVMGVLEDCRSVFDSLTELTGRRQSGCCDVLLRPQDVAGAGLQAVVDRFTGKGRVTICLTPGTYRLPEPLRLGRQHSHLTIEACHDGAVLEAAKGAEDEFFDGLVVLDHADNVTLRGLRFHLPQVRWGAGGHVLESPALKSLAAATRTLNVTVGVHPVHCAVLTVEDCLFRYTLDPNKDCFGAGILAQSECWGHRIRGNRFIRDEEYLRQGSRRTRTLFGYLLASSLSADAAGATVVPALLQDGAFQDNRFTGLLAAIFVVAVNGTVEVERNTVRDCYGGFGLLPLRWFAARELLRRVEVPDKLAATAAKLADVLASVTADPVLQIGGTLARIHPLPAGAKVASVASDPDQAAREAEEVVAGLGELLQAIGPLPGGKGGRRGGGGGRRRQAAPSERTRLREAGETAGRLGFSRPAFARFTAAQAELSELERSALSALTDRVLRLSLRLSDNDVQALGEQEAAGSSLSVMGDLRKPGDLTMVGNRFRSPTSGHVAYVASVQQCAISGNVLLNEGSDGTSLRVFPGATPGPTGDRTPETVAVAGNVLGGYADLPPRPLPAPLDTWDVFNAEM